MSETEEENDRLSESETVSKVSGEIEVPERIVKDVQLIVDSFGFTSKLPSPKKPAQALPRKRSRNQSGDLSNRKESSEMSYSVFSDESTDTDSQNDVATMEIVKRFTWITRNKLTVQLITYGATITSIKAPDRYGFPVDIIMGFDNMDDYKKFGDYFFGSTIGRVANFVENASFSIGDLIYVLESNKYDHQFNSGHRGFDKANWDWCVEDTTVILSYLSPDGDGGYPGNLLTQISYQVTVDNTLKIQMHSTTTKATPVNISNHIYFNLAGHNAGPQSLYDHIVTINADKYTPDNDEHLPTGIKLPVGGSLFDFRLPKMLSDVIPLKPGDGYDVNFCITKGADQALAFGTRVLHPRSGRVIEIYSNQPGLQFHTSNNLPNPDIIREGIKSSEPPITSRNGAKYSYHGAFCMQTQNFPNAMHHKNFPNSILYPGKEYVHEIVYRFGLQLGKYC